MYGVLPLPKVPIQKVLTESEQKRLERAKRVNDFMSRKTTKHERGYRWQVGYHKCVGYYSAGFEDPRFSGSSLNRKFINDRKNSYEQNLHSKARDLVEMAAKANNWTVDGLREYEYHISGLRDKIKSDAEARRRDREDKRKSSSGVPGSLRRLPGSLHVFSHRSKSKVRDKATAFYRSSGRGKCFVTLTFIAKVSDKSARTILNTFLTQIRKKYSNLEYLWVVERQAETGNAHFHMIVNRRLPVSVYNPLWVLCQYNAGLVGKNKYGNEIPIEVIHAAYKARTMGKILNPFDIKKIKSINNLSNYLTKYIVKQPDGVGFDCANWHCSRGVSRLFTKMVCGVDVFEKLKGEKNYSVDFESGEMFFAKPHKEKFWTSIKVLNKECIVGDIRELEVLNSFLLAGENMLPDWRHLPMVDDDDYRKFFYHDSDLSSSSLFELGGA
jgi:hypothetical protein